MLYFCLQDCNTLFAKHYTLFITGFMGNVHLVSNKLGDKLTVVKHDRLTSAA